MCGEVTVDVVGEADVKIILSLLALELLPLQFSCKLSSLIPRCCASIIVRCACNHICLSDRNTNLRVMPQLMSSCKCCPACGWQVGRWLRSNALSTSLAPGVNVTLRWCFPGKHSTSCTKGQVLASVTLPAEAPAPLKAQFSLSKADLSASTCT